jgi:hypothetical protein
MRLTAVSAWSKFNFGDERSSAGGRLFVYDYTVFDSKDCHGKLWVYRYEGTYLVSNPIPNQTVIKFSVQSEKLLADNDTYPVDDYKSRGQISILWMDRSALHLGRSDDLFHQSGIVIPGEVNFVSIFKKYEM